MVRTVFRFAAPVFALALYAPANAELLVFDSPLEPEVPGATGSGYAAVTFDTVAKTLQITTGWSGLSGQTTVAHIHCCVASPGTVGVAVTPGTFPGFPTGVSSGSYAVLLDLNQSTNFTAGFLNNFGGGTVAGAQAALLAGFQNGTSYLNIHSNLFPGGEIRGFLSPVPEPATWAMMVAGFGMAGLVMRRGNRRAVLPRTTA